MKILVLHGPNLNLLGKRNVMHYGNLTQKELFQMLKEQFPNVSFDFYQSNHEGQLIDWIQTADHFYNGLLINPGAYTHTSVAIRDALEVTQCLKVAVHLSDITKRENFRQTDYVQAVCDQTFMGKQAKSYVEAIAWMIEQPPKKVNL
ncbi:MAG: type II 3-dehydroquinate dehydratase [Acholeplasmataceae bacterium]|nr:3-dehydroquinate dehydratase [Acholeplasmataceae bacterium]